jgi:signal transduction histidine kinase
LGASVRRSLMTLADDYRTTLLEGIVVTAQAVLIIGLVLERRRRRRAEELLEQRLEFETLVSELTSHLGMVDRAEHDLLITRWLQRLANSLGVDRANLLPAANGNGHGPPPALAHMPKAWGCASAYPATDFPALTESVQRGEVVRFNSLEVLPPALARDRQAFRRNGIESALLVPLRYNGAVLGALALSARKPQRWTTAIVERLEFVGAILARALNSDQHVKSNGHSNGDAAPAEATVVAAATTVPVEPSFARFAGVRTLGGFALSLAHELNQPLSAILANAQAARRFLARPDPPIDEVRAIIDDIDADDRRAGELIHGMRALLNHHDVEPVELDVNDIIRDVVRLLHGDCLLRRVSLVLDLEAPLPAIRCDRVQIEHVLLNIVMNGFEAMEETVPGNRRMIIRTRLGEGACVISIRDAGTGIPEDKFERIFEQFYSTKTEGLGMGLAFVRSVVESHGGRIWATNNSDVGATFHVALPIAVHKEES